MPPRDLSRRFFLAESVGLPFLARTCIAQDKAVVVAQGDNIGVPSGGGNRKALVIGNQAYPGIDQLTFPARDAELVAGSLEEVGFACIPKLNLPLAEMERAVDDFVKSLRRGDEALVYFSGHAFQAGQQNVLCPLDFRPLSSSRAYAVARLYERVLTTGVEVAILILDACRELAGEPIRGLAPLSAPKGAFIALATQPGETIPDDHKFAKCLAAEIRTCDQSIDQVFMNVRKCVARPAKLFPETRSGLEDPFFFRTPVIYKPSDIAEIKEGTYPIGVDEWEHPANVAQFLITRYRVSLDDYQKIFRNEDDAVYASDGHSVINVPWRKAFDCCRAVRYGKASGPRGSLPTEVQWEVAARHGKDVFGFSDGVGEWCADRYVAVPGSAPTQERVIRGLGGIGQRDRSPEGHLLKIFNKRGDLTPLNVGFRVVFPAT